jgi:hypothetical protein
MAAWLQAPGNLPADLSIGVGTTVSSPEALVLQVVWAQGFPGWVDASPWPTSLSIIGVPTTGGPLSPTYFRVENAPGTPSPGQSVALFDATNLVFRRKKILTVANDAALDGSYDLTVDTTNSVSDLSYTPLVNQGVYPWSESLATLIAPAVSYFASLGPGEMFGGFVDPGSRQRRNPSSPAVWPSELAMRIFGGPTSAQVVAQGATAPGQEPTFASLTSLLDVIISDPELPAFPTTGTPGVSVYMFTLGDLGAYP